MQQDFIENLVGEPLIDIYEKVMDGKRLSYNDGLKLYHSNNLTAIGFLANIIREQKHHQNTYFVRNQHINYTNICNKFCKFCGFYAKKGGPKPYEMSLEKIRSVVKKYINYPLTEIHIVGGVNPRLSYNYYLDMLRMIKEIRPDVHIKAFTAVEIVEIARVGKVSIENALKDLIEAGLDSLPGGGIEVLSKRVHQELFQKKLDGDGWLDVARTAAKIGLKQYATMLYGHIETAEERIEHLIQLRELQDETNHFLCMTPLSFHPEGTELSHISTLTGYDDLKNIAISRLMLDNFDHIKSFWIMNTPEITQMSLWYGADDADGLVQDYEITYITGDYGNKKQFLTYDNMTRMIREANRNPIERDSLYREINRGENNSNIRTKAMKRLHVIK